MSDTRKLSRKLFSKRVETGETKPNPTIRQFETYEIEPLRSDLGGKFFGFKGEEIVGTRRGVRKRRGQFKEFTDVGITGDYGGKINRRLAPYRYGERDPKFFKDTGVRSAETGDRPYTSIFLGERGERNFQRSIEEIMNTPTYLEDQRFFRRPIPAIPIYVDKDGNLRNSGKGNAIVSKESFQKIADKYMVRNKEDITPSKVKPSVQMLRNEGNEYLVSVLKERPPKPFKEGGVGPRILTKRGATGSNPEVFEGRVEPSNYRGLQNYPTGLGPSLVGGKGVDFPLDEEELKKDLEARALTRGDTGLLSLDGERVFSNMKKEYERKYGAMTRAQQRKLGRIIKNRITKPIRIGTSMSVVDEFKTEVDFVKPSRRETAKSFDAIKRKYPVMDYSESFFSDEQGNKLPITRAPKELLNQLEQHRAKIKMDVADKVYFTSDVLDREEGELKYNTLSFKGNIQISGGQLHGFSSLKDEGLGYVGTGTRNKLYRDLSADDMKKLKDAEKKYRDYFNSPIYLAKKAKLDKEKERVEKMGFSYNKRIINPFENEYLDLKRRLPDKFYKDDRPVPFKHKDKTYKFNIRGKKTKIPYVIVKGVKTKPVGSKYLRTGAGTNLFGDTDFTMRMTGRGGGRRFYTLKEKDKKLEWWQRGKNQQEVSRRIDAESVPPQQYQLRGIRDPRSAGGRIIPPRNVRRIDHSQTYKSARDEALIQMRINESAGVRGAKKKIEEVRQSEAEKRKNLVLARKTAEETAKALKAKNAGLTHSYAVNVRNHSNATLLGSDPDELNKILKRGGGIALLKDMVRKGEITDLSTIAQLDLSVRNKNALIKLLNEGGEFVEGNEYFYRFIDDFGNTKVGRGFLNKGGDRALNLDLMYIRTNEDGTQTKERRLVPKKNIISPDEPATTTSSGKQQKPRGERRLRKAELEAFGLDLGATPEALAEVGLSPALIPVERKTRGRSEEVDRPPQQGILGILQNQGEQLIEGEAPRTASPPTSEEEFQFSAPEPELASGLTMYGKSPKAQREEAAFNKELEEEIDAFVEARSEGLAPQSPPEDALADFTAFELGETSLEQQLAEAEAQSPPATDTTLDEILAETLELQQEEEEEQKPQKPDRPPPKPPTTGGATPKKAKTPTGEKPKRVQFDLGEEESSFTTEGFSSEYSDYNFDSILPAEDFIVGNLERKGKKERLGELLDTNQIFLWSTKYGGDSNKSKRGLVVDRDDIGALAKSAIGRSVKVSGGKTKKISPKQATKLYIKVLKDLNAGKQETAFNDEAFVRLFGIEPRIEGEAEP